MIQMLYSDVKRIFLSVEKQQRLKNIRKIWQYDVSPLVQTMTSRVAISIP